MIMINNLVKNFQKFKKLFNKKIKIIIFQTIRVNMKQIKNLMKFKKVILINLHEQLLKIFNQKKFQIIKN